MTDDGEVASARFSAVALFGVSLVFLALPGVAPRASTLPTCHCLGSNL